MNSSLTTNLQVGKNSERPKRGRRILQERDLRVITPESGKSARQQWQRSKTNKQTNRGGTWEFEKGNLVGNIAKPVADMGASVCAMGREGAERKLRIVLCAFCSIQGTQSSTD